MVTSVNTASSTPRSSRLMIGSAIMAAAGVGFIGYAILFLIRNYSHSFLELGIGVNEVSVNKAQIIQFSPSLYHYIGHLHLALSGFIASTGTAVTLLAWLGVRRGQMWAWVAAVAAPVVGLAVALPAHYPYHFDTLGHLGLVYGDTLLFLAGALIALGELRKIRTARG